eukprot:TRINITY_DN190_c0_g1_i3.p1 TRINITY_DN190_c0_g1~~TRINITY_DN190_c0_g1_i3.p1  ORF type:complete len:161 (+),score=112.44 TRINITY_DN190_c0_g1_i3:33-485(+)
MGGQAVAEAQPEVKEEKKAAAADDEDFDPFADEEQDEEAAAMLARKQAEAAAAKDKKKKDAPIAKSTVLLEVKPFDSETDMKELENAVRAIEMEGLLWGASKLEKVAYGVMKLIINAVIVDDLVSVDDLQTGIEALEFVQSTDIAAFNKI